MTNILHSAVKQLSNLRAEMLACVVVFALSAVLPVQAAGVQWVETPLAGDDHDHDGVRDDVAAEIRTQYKPDYRHWPMEIARAGQRLLLSDGNPFAIHRGQAEMRRAIACIARQSGKLAAGNVRDEILQQVLNNDDRREAYLEAVALWENDIRHRDLPSRPDDRWQAGCEAEPGTVRVVSYRSAPGPAPRAAGPAVKTRPATPSPQPAERKTPAMSSSFKTEVVMQKDLPPPNSFETGEQSRSADPQPAAGETPRQYGPTAVPEQEESLPGAFRVQRETAGQKYSAAFGVNYTPSAASARIEQQRSAEAALANSTMGEYDTLPPADNHSPQPPSVVYETEASRPEEPEQVDLSPAPEPDDITAPPAELVDLRPPPEDEPEDESRGEDKVVVVIRKGKPVDGADLPDELRDLAPFIKDYRYNQ